MKTGAVVLRISLVISPTAILLCMKCGMFEDPFGYENEFVGLYKILVGSISLPKNVGDLYIVRSRKLHDCVEISAVNLIFF